MEGKTEIQQTLKEKKILIKILQRSLHASASGKCVVHSQKSNFHWDGGNYGYTLDGWNAIIVQVL